jgi:hypothetical protein
MASGRKFIDVVAAEAGEVETPVTFGFEVS